MIAQTLERDFDLTEIINGEEIMGPSPFGRHQRISMNLSDIISPYVRRNKLGRLFSSPLDVILKEAEQRLQPDILFIRKGNMGIFQDWVRGVPDMVCEIVATTVDCGATEQEAHYTQLYGFSHAIFFCEGIDY
ncbi:MAG: Uma2 family endonuclease [Candidatus Magnetobacterium sp. LHC-1]|uniref:Uma2 family endonuclease n=1 Tax=Candidatus Magnetobacterium casense TaxID=1455061 RepID=A0ABS6RU33_9BACT|nr:Uma2 family endonuclease [Candidatus Magnetobacterium casensis]MBF0608113.1 Uma2 family endonuclease [Nitrospirota bacterium]MBV6340091.1 Uma2 family endonuclease [Candidatus Magnetobacterium casensis]